MSAQGAGSEDDRVFGFLAQRCCRIAFLGRTALTCLVFSLISAAPAVAFNCGYGPCTGVASSVPGFTSVVAADTFSASGGTFSGAAHGATATVTVPKGSLPKGGEVVIAGGTPSSIQTGNSSTVVVGFSVEIVDPNTGAKLSGPFNPPITLVITDPAIAPGDTVVFVSGPGHVTTVSGAQVTQGRAVVKFTRDPAVAVLRAHINRPDTLVNTALLGLSGVFSGDRRGLIADPGKKFAGEKLVVRVNGKYLSSVAVKRDGKLQLITSAKAFLKGAIVTLSKGAEILSSLKVT